MLDTKLFFSFKLIVIYILWIVQKLSHTSASKDINTNVKIRILYKPEYVAHYAFTEHTIILQTWICSLQMIAK